MFQIKMKNRLQAGKPKLRTADFDYSLPESFIAQNPVSPRDHSKLLVYDTKADRIYHKRFFELEEFLSSNDVLVLNRSKVVPARILFRLDGKEREIFLLKHLDDERYLAMVRPGKVFKLGKSFSLSSKIRVLVQDVLEDGTRVLRFFGKNVAEELDNMGKMPLPPYVSDSQAAFEDYQTVYAKEKGSVAAPTAGLHFTGDLLKRLSGNGVNIEEVVLHVGRGTFLPVSADLVEDHQMHSEMVILDAVGAGRLNAAQSEGKRLIAVGTTSVRVLESCYDGTFQPGTFETDIFIYPGEYRWKVVDALITNFHLPKSTLIMLVASFLESKGVEDPIAKILELYELAKEHDYRFFSFGDAMFIY